MKIKLELFGASKDFSNENIIEFNLKRKMFNKRIKTRSIKVY